MKMRFLFTVGLLLSMAATHVAAQNATPSVNVEADRAGDDAGVKEVVHANAEKSVSPKIDVVFVLDTTGSMSGLIHAAQEKIWAIANTISKAEGKPSIRMGLVGYRDLGDEYVTVHTGLSEDIDAMYRDLMGYKADGGGDLPESVNQALNEAVGKMSWREGADVYRVIFLVGDAPPHMYYQDDVKYAQSCESAKARGIFINSIQCGRLQETKLVWNEIAELAAGTYAAIPQSGGAVLPPTPFDKGIAELSVELDATRLYYGSALEKKEQLDRSEVGKNIAERSSVQAVAQRAAFNACAAGNGNFCGNQELVNDVEEGKVKLDELKKEQLPDGLQDLSLEKLKDAVSSKSAERKKLQSEIGALTAKRQDWLKTQLAESGKEQPELDRIIFSAIKEQAAKAGISFGEGTPSL
ncbi:MAG: vWA domain-containing protein [Pirellulales bacterium]